MKKLYLIILLLIAIGIVIAFGGLDKLNELIS